MKLRLGSLGGGLFAVLLASAAPAAAAPIVFGNNAYEYVLAGGISWNAANAAAIGSTFSGQSGHLATITSAAENAFIDLIVNSGTEAWIGGFQPPGSPEPAGNWQWVNGEGLFTYTNWSA